MTQKGKAEVAFSWEEELMTLTRDIVQRWKEHFKEPLYLAIMSSVGEAESEDSGEEFSMSLAEVAE